MKVRFDAFLPVARWGPLFHVMSLERLDLRLEWEAVGFPLRHGSLLGDADVGLFLAPPERDGLTALTIDTSPMVVVLAAGHRLAHHHELRVAELLDEPFPGGADLDPGWVSFWTLDAQRGGPPRLTDHGVQDARHWLEAVAAGEAIGTVPAWVPDGLPHPGIIALPIVDGPPVETRLVWRAGAETPEVTHLVELARDMTRRRR